MKRAFFRYLNRHLHLVAQPIIDLSTHQIVELEMLARNAADRCPVALLGAAGRMPWSAAMLDQAIIELALDQTRLGASQPVRIGINVSRHGIASGACLQALKQHANGFYPERIVIELSEGDPLRVDERALRHGLKDLRAHGFRIALDDTGSGSTGLRQMFVLPYDSIKLDISVTRALPKVLQRSDIGLPEIITALHNRGVTVVAEGVETPQELRAVMAVGCGCAQGYLLGRPVQVPQMLAALRLPPGVAPRAPWNADAGPAARPRPDAPHTQGQRPGSAHRPPPSTLAALATGLSTEQAHDGVKVSVLDYPA